MWHTFVSSWKSFPNTQREEKFINLVKRFKVHKTKMISKINIKLIDKYSGLEKSSVTLNVFKICSEKLDDFIIIKIVRAKPLIQNVSKWSDTRLSNSTFQCTSLFRLTIIHLGESSNSKMTRVKLAWVYVIL